MRYMVLFLLVAPGCAFSVAEDLETGRDVLDDPTAVQTDVLVSLEGYLGTTEGQTKRLDVGPVAKHLTEHGWRLVEDRARARYCVTVHLIDYRSEFASFGGWLTYDAFMALPALVLPVPLVVPVDTLTIVDVWGPDGWRTRRWAAVKHNVKFLSIWSAFAMVPEVIESQQEVAADAVTHVLNELVSESP